MKNLASALFLLLLVASAAHMAIYYPQLPDTLASHFGLSGDPDGWTSKQSFVTIYAVVVAVIGVMFFGLAFFLPKFPESMINVPYREYWLAPERRDESLAAMTEILLWLGNLTLIFIIAVMHLAFETNLGHRQGLGSTFFVLLCGYSLAMVFVAIRLQLRFKRRVD